MFFKSLYDVIQAKTSLNQWKAGSRLVLMIFWEMKGNNCEVIILDTTLYLIKYQIMRPNPPNRKPNLGNNDIK